MICTGTADPSETYAHYRQKLGPANPLGEALPSALISPMGYDLAKGLLEPIRKLGKAARTPAGRAVLVYLLVAPAAQVVLTVVGSLSEYRCADGAPESFRSI